MSADRRKRKPMGVVSVVWFTMALALGSFLPFSSVAAAGARSTEGGHSAATSSFAGCVKRQSIDDVGAEWTIPAILSASPPGNAATWVGAYDRSGPFLQIGVLEEKPTYATSDWDVEYEVFWSDTKKGDYPQVVNLSARAGDVVKASLTDVSNGWRILFKNISNGEHWKSVVSYPAHVFSTAEWMQEDPQESPNHVKAGRYPNMTDVTMSHLFVNDRTPSLSFRDCTCLVSMNGKVVVPTTFTDDGFSDRQATPEMIQYLDDVAPFNLAVTEFLREFKPNRASSATRKGRGKAEQDQPNGVDRNGEAEVAAAR